MYIRSTALALCSLFAHANVQASDALRASGSPQAKATVDARVKPIYEKAGPWTHTLDSGGAAGNEPAIGSEVNGGLFEGRYARLYVGAWSKLGKYSAEYYLDQGKVAFVYETFEYFETAAPAGEWKNFKGIAAWERRTYIQSEAVVYAESKGHSAPALETSPTRLQSQADGFVSRLERRRSRG